MAAQIETTGVVLKKYNTLGEANVVKSLLEGYGVDAFIRDPNMNNVFPNIPITAKGIELIVREEDYDKAKEILSAKFDKKDIQ